MNKLETMQKAILDKEKQLACRRRITHIVVHCTGGQPHQSLDSIQAHWRKLGWKNPGYHLLIDAAGNSHHLADIDKVVNGARKYNAHGIHIAYVGGYGNVDTRTPAQVLALAGAITNYHNRFPEAVVCGHRDLSPDTNHNGRVDPCEWVKACPCFDVKEAYKHIINK